MPKKGDPGQGQGSGEDEAKPGTGISWSQAFDHRPNPNIMVRNMSHSHYY